MKFKDFPYHRIDFDEFSKKYKKAVKQVSDSKSFEETYLHLIEINQLEQVFCTYATISEAGNTGNTLDPFYEKEEAFFGEVKPFFAMLQQERDTAILNSSFKEQLRTLLGDEFINRITLVSTTMNDQITPLMLEENKVSQEFSNTISQIKLKDDEGNTLSISDAARKGNSSDREVRRKYNIIMERGLAKQGPKFDEQFDSMLKSRKKIADLTGYETYTDYCYSLRGRTGYGREEIAKFTQKIEEEIVPVVNQIFENKRKEMGLEELYVYDEGFSTKGDVKVEGEVLPSFKKIFGALSPETKVFYDELLQKESYDLDLREGKINGGYSNYMALYSFPYIFESYNSTPGAVRTFAHECGHGLNSFLHRGEPLMYAVDPSSDVCETHSMSMEFFVWPYLDEIINKDDIDLYKYNHLVNALSFLPYGTAVNEFQTIVYDNPELTPDERRQVWKDLEKRFLPWRKYEKGLFGDQGRMWQRQMHVMKWPFYYIDYVLAQTVSIQFHLLDEKDHDKAWNTYLEFIQNSGKYSFTKTVEKAGLKTPFEDDVLKEIADIISKRLKEYE